MRARRILIVDDDADFRQRVRNSLGTIFRITEAASEVEFRQLYRPYLFDLIVLDLRLRHGHEGMDLLREVRLLDDLQPVIMVSAYGDTDSTLDAIEAGAMMFLHKQEFTPELLGRMVEAVLQQCRSRRNLEAMSEFIRAEASPGLLGADSAIRRASQMAWEAAGDGETAVLVLGAAGTEREEVGRLIHECGRRRREGPFVATTPCALTGPESAELFFGHGGFEGCPRRRGKLEEASGGVLFLERADALAASVGTLLGRGLRARKVNAEVAGIELPLDVQLVAGAEPGPGAAGVKRWLSESGHIHEIYLPPLRDRREDIPVLAARQLQRLRQRGRTPVHAFSTEAISALQAYAWPANLLELSNAVEFAAIRALVAGASEIAAEHLPSRLREGESDLSRPENRDFRRYLARAEVQMVARAARELHLTQKAKLAEALGYNDRFGLMRRMRRCLKEFPFLGKEFPAMQKMFGGRAQPPRQVA